MAREQPWRDLPARDKSGGSVHVSLVLTTADCHELLERNHIGRLAFTHAGGIDIEPLGYAFNGTWLFMRSAYGSKLEALAHNPFVAFQVDEVKGPFDWRSVVVHGTI